MPVTKLSTLNSSGNSEESIGYAGTYLPAAGGGVNSDFNDANQILQSSLGRAVSTTEDLGDSPDFVPENNANPVHSKTNVDAVLLD